MLKCYIEGKNLINGVEEQFNISQGAVFTETYNETLDSGTIILPQLFKEIDIEPYDVLVVFSTEDSNCKIATKRMCVDTYVCTQTSLNPAIYKYEISLFSETKLLEGILLPSLSITKLLVGSPRSIRYYLEEYLNEYGTKTNSSEASGSYGNKFTFSDVVKNRFNSIVCPELQWNEPNLREVLTDLMMVDNCIPVIKNNVIDLIDISQSFEEITEEQRKGINYIQKSQSSSDYVSEIKTRIINSVGEDEKTKICENITFRNYETYILTTENVKLETTFPIYKLLNMNLRYFVGAKVIVKGKGPNTGFTKVIYYRTDLKRTLYDENYKGVLEYGEWQTKPIFYASMGNVMSYSTDYQNTCLYYRRGDKGILNFNSKQEGIGFLWIPFSKSVLEMLCNDYTANYNLTLEQFAIDYPEYSDPDLYEYYYEDQSGPRDIDWKNCNFELEYETLGEYMLFVSKSGALNKRQIVDNQTQSYVNAKTYGILEYLKANRLGNKIKLINGRYEVDEVNIPQLAYKIDGSIIFKKEIAVYDNYIKVNYQATDNYVLRDYFTSVKSKLRSWRIINGSEALTRTDNIKFYVNPKTMNSFSNPWYTLPVYKVLDGNGNLDINATLQMYMSKLNYCVIKFDISEYEFLPKHDEMLFKNVDYGIDGYMMEIQKIICGKSILLSIRCLDNAIVGKYVTNDEYDIGNYVKTMTQQNAKYVDENGENIGGVIYLYENYSIDNLSIYETYTGEEYQKKEQINTTKTALHDLLPGVARSGDYCGLSNLVARIPFNFKKDNKEITQITIQFEINEDANDIFLGRK